MFSRSALVTPYAKFPTYNFVATMGLLQNSRNTTRPTRAKCRHMKNVIVDGTRERKMEMINWRRITATKLCRTQEHCYHTRRIQISNPKTSYMDVPLGVAE